MSDENLTIIITQDQIIPVVVSQDPILPVVVNIGERGIPGDQGLQGEKGDPGSTLIYANAGQILSGHRAAVIESDGKAYYADQTNTAHAWIIAGITTGAAIQDEQATIQGAGLMEEPTWDWDAGLPVFISGDGYLTQTCPNTGFIVSIGTAVSQMSILINISQPIIAG